MSLLCVCVKSARLSGIPDKFHTYVTLKLQNVKSTTIAVRGNTPSWEQDFMFETMRLDTGLIVELWNKGMLWDKLIGLHWLPLMGVHHSNQRRKRRKRLRGQEGDGKWLSLDAELIMRNGEPIGTQCPTGHSVRIDARFELPYDLPESEAAELQNKLEELNTIMDHEQIMTIKDQHRRNTYSQSGMSEDSDYTSDINFPTHTHHPNTSAHQFPRNEHPYRGRREDSQEYSRDPYYRDSFDQSFEQSFDQDYDRDLDYPTPTRSLDFVDERDYPRRDDLDYRRQDPSYDSHHSNYGRRNSGYGRQNPDYLPNDRDYDDVNPDYDDRLNPDYDDRDPQYNSPTRDYRGRISDYRTESQDYNSDYSGHDHDYNKRDADYNSRDGDLKSRSDFNSRDGDFKSRSDPDFDSQNGDFKIRSDDEYMSRDGDYKTHVDSNYDSRKSNFNRSDTELTSRESLLTPQEQDYRSNGRDYNSRVSDFQPHDSIYHSRDTDYQKRGSDDYYQGSPYHTGPRSDTDSEPLFYNSRPINNNMPQSFMTERDSTILSSVPP